MHTVYTRCLLMQSLLCLRLICCCQSVGKTLLDCHRRQFYCNDTTGDFCGSQCLPGAAVQVLDSRVFHNLPFISHFGYSCSCCTWVYILASTCMFSFSQGHKILFVSAWTSVDSYVYRYTFSKQNAGFCI